MKQVNEHGRSLIEMLGVLTIISVITIAGFQVIGIATNRYRAADIQSDVEGIVQGIYDLYSFKRHLPSQGYGQDICNNKLIGRNCDSYETNKAVWKNSFGGNIEVQILNTSDAQDVVVTYTNVPKAACQRLTCLTTWRLVVPSSQREAGCVCGKSCDFCADINNTMTFTSK